MKEMRLMRAIGEIDDKYVEEAAQETTSKAIRFGSWAKYAGIAACAVLVLGIGVFAVKQGVAVDTPAQTDTAVTSADDSEFSQVGNPYEYFDTLEEAEKNIGFEITAPADYGNYTNVDYTVISGYILQIGYYDESDSEGLSVRKSASAEDISGDYNTYENIAEITSDNRQITLKGSGDKYYLAVWNDGGYSYAVSVKPGASEAEITELVKNIK